MATCSSSVLAAQVMIGSERKRFPHRCLQIQALRRNDEGTSGSMVDSSLTVLKNRIEEIKVKDGLERCLKLGQIQTAGWNYVHTCDHKYKKFQQKSMELSEVALMVAGTFGLPLLSGTLCLYMASILVHLNQ